MQVFGLFKPQRVDTRGETLRKMWDTLDKGPLEKRETRLEVAWGVDKALHMIARRDGLGLRLAALSWPRQAAWPRSPPTRRSTCRC